MKQNKYRYVKVIQGNYGLGWEDLSEYDQNDRQEVRTMLPDFKEYRLAEPQHRHRIIRRRVPNQEVKQ